MAPWKMEPGIYFSVTLKLWCEKCQRHIEEVVCLKFPKTAAYGCKDCHTLLIKLAVDPSIGHYRVYRLC
jgi:hypothetical protein